MLVARAAAAPVLATLVPADDARGSIAIGPAGEVYAPDGKGAWVRTLPVSTATAVKGALRSGTDVFAAGDGVIYRLSERGWSAVRVAQKGKAILSSGSRGFAATGKQLLALDRLAAGEPVRVATASTEILAIGGGTRGALVAMVGGGLAKLTGAKLVPLRRQPSGPVVLVDDRWATSAAGLVDLSGAAPRTIAWPAGFRPVVASPIAGGSVAVVGIAAPRGAVALVTLGKKDAPVVDLVPGAARDVVGVAVDRAGRAVVAFADGTIAVRERGAWTSAAVTSQLPARSP